MQEIVKYEGCFVCGDRNPDGLRIPFYYDGDRAIADYVSDAKFQGYPGVFHGGLVATLLDEIMAKAVLARQRYCMTAEMSIRYKQAVPVGEKLQLIGWVTTERGRLLETQGEIRGADGVVYATATGKYLEAPASIRDALLTGSRIDNIDQSST